MDVTRIHVCWSPVYEVTDSRGKVWRFTYHPYLGPTVVRKNDDPFKRQPSEKSPFWAALETWDMPEKLRAHIHQLRTNCVQERGTLVYLTDLT